MCLEDNRRWTQIRFRHTILVLREYVYVKLYKYLYYHYIMARCLCVSSKICSLKLAGLAILRRQLPPRCWKRGGGLRDGSIWSIVRLCLVLNDNVYKYMYVYIYILYVYMCIYIICISAYGGLASQTWKLALRTWARCSFQRHAHEPCWLHGKEFHPVCHARPARLGNWLYAHDRRSLVLLKSTASQARCLLLVSVSV